MEILELPDGTKINAETGEVLGAVVEKRDLVVASRRRADELPSNGKLYALIAALEIWGLNKVDIASVLDKPYDAINELMQDEQYKVFRGELIDGVLAAETDNVHQMFIQNSLGAAKSMIAMMDSSIPEIRMGATKDVLDRGGFRPADIVEHRHKIENDLKIVYVEDKKKAIDADFVELERHA